MVPPDSTLERMFVGIAHALFMNRLHLLRLTEIVRLNVKPREDDGFMEVPPDLDSELKQQAVDYVLTCFPREFAEIINQVKADWLRPA